MANRQWGAEKPRRALPAVERRASDQAMFLGGVGIVVTISAWLVYVVWTVVGEFVNNGLQSMRFILEAASYVMVMTFLTFSALMYLIARQGAMHRSRSHVRVPRADLDDFYASNVPTLTTLIPSFKENPEVVRATLLSAALQEYPHMRIVLLIDDPPDPKDVREAARLQACRDLPQEVAEWLREPAARFEDALARHEAAAVPGAVGSPESALELAAEYEWAAKWLSQAAEEHPRETHIDEFVVNEVIGQLAANLSVTGAAIRQAADEGSDLPVARMTQLYRSLAWIFRTEIDSFERKSYVSLSHEANKAMNLNSYIGLMGNSYDEVQTPAGTVLRRAAGRSGQLVIPDSDFLLTLDADSVILPEYCLRLVHFLEQPDNQRVSIAQTPYSAFRGAPTRLERIAGATTDLQHIIHQGLTYYRATFWVGANAVIRKVALDDIVEVEYTGGREIRRYVQDRTVIEDTESSIDFVAAGWVMANYPERLSYSATPPDFGALAVQRTRWANGGLLILPKYWRFARSQRRAGNPVSLSEFFLRMNYMASIAWAGLGLLFLLAFPYDSKLLSPIILVAALPYFIAQSSDLHRLGYKRTDVFRIYGFNLLLLPINLTGVVRSLQQAATKSKIAFSRTPKVSERTAAPALAIIAAFAILAFSALTFRRDVNAQNWANAAFAAFNGLLVAYAIVAFVGLRSAVVDVFLGMAHWIRVPTKHDQASSKDSAPDWQAVLYFGADDGSHEARSPIAPLPTPHIAPSEPPADEPVVSPEQRAASRLSAE